ncbi:hypothetical protein PR002_g22339 [Phytophthora rubi]|uniref:Uncharacterized protein n=1 Tax=Phytophthora rubi TaxID=129364 RepID=A0A6A3J4U1_9STRA|nr:hypothetical protein PR002_g22339 [Phytophthora rubi]
MLMWLGGKAARHSVAAKAKAGSVVTSQTDLATLYRTDRARYDRILANALDPYHIDEEGYKSIPELLEQTNALDPTRKPHLRLNDEALARIVFDVNSGPPPTTAWVGNKSSGPWKVLLSNRRIHEVQVYIAKKLKKGTYEVPGEEKPFKPKEQGDADSDFLDDEDMFTTLAPTPPVEGGYPAGSSDDEDAEELEEKLPADEAPDEDDEDPEDPPDQGGEGEPSDEPPAKSKGSDSSASATKSK